MQLIHTRESKKNKKINIKAALTLATTALLGTNVQAQTEEDTWDFDSAFLFYSEADRVSAAEGIFSAKKTLKMMMY